MRLTHLKQSNAWSVFGSLQYFLLHSFERVVKNESVVVYTSFQCDWFGLNWPDGTVQTPEMHLNGAVLSCPVLRVAEPLLSGPCPPPPPLIPACVLLERRFHLPRKFSRCSVDEYIQFLLQGGGSCLFNKPNKVRAMWLRRMQVRVAASDRRHLQNIACAMRTSLDLCRHCRHVSCPVHLSHMYSYASCPSLSCWTLLSAVMALWNQGRSVTVDPRW